MNKKTILFLTIFLYVVNTLNSVTISEKFGKISPFDPFKKFYDKITSGEYSGVLFALVTFIIIYSILNIGGKKLAKGDKQLIKLVNIISFSVGLITSAGAYIVFKSFNKFQDIFWLFAGFFGFLLFNYIGYEFLKAGREGLAKLEDAGWTGVPNNPDLISKGKAGMERLTGRTVPFLTILSAGVMFFLAGLSLMKFVTALAHLNNIPLNNVVKVSSLSLTPSTTSPVNNPQTSVKNPSPTPKKETSGSSSQEGKECINYDYETKTCKEWASSEILGENDISSESEVTKEQFYIYSTNGKMVEDGKTYYLEGGNCKLGNDEEIKELFYCESTLGKKGTLRYTPQIGKNKGNLICYYNGKKVASIIISKERCK